MQVNVRGRCSAAADGSEGASSDPCGDWRNRFTALVARPLPFPQTDKAPEAAKGDLMGGLAAALANRAKISS